MGWLRKILELSTLDPKDVVGPEKKAERLTSSRPKQIVRDVAELVDREVVQAWLRELGPQADQQVLVHRNWAQSWRWRMGIIQSVSSRVTVTRSGMQSLREPWESKT